MNFNGKITDIGIDFETGKTKVTLLADSKENFTKVLAELKQEDKLLNIDIKNYRKKRSKDANAYLWTLCGKLAEVLGSTKEEVYKEAVSKVGQYEIIPIKEVAVKIFMDAWQSKGIAFICEILGPSKIEGYTNLIVYYGSSTYNSRDMSILLNYVVEECHSLGIDTKSDKEINDLLEAWGML